MILSKNRMWLLPVATVLLALGLGLAVFIKQNRPDAPLHKWDWNLPAHFPEPMVHADNPMSEAKVDLGRHLFYDKRLSGNGTMSCASCHHQDKAFTDGLGRAVGSTGQLHPRGAQSLANVVYHTTLTWANPSLLSLERQMQVPMFGDNPVEMGVSDHNKDEVLARIQADSLYQKKLSAAFPSEQAKSIHWEHILKAISSFQNSLISANSPYDQYLQGKATLSLEQTRGKDLFFSEKAACFRCHGSFNFNDQVKYGSGLQSNVSQEALRQLIASQDALPSSQAPFHNTGLYNVDEKGAYPEGNQGLMEITGRPADMGKFRAPSLRNVAVTAPYMHDGSVATLEQALSNYAAGGRNIKTGSHAGDGRKNPFKSEVLSAIELTQQDQADLIAFLKTLTDTEFLNNPKYADPFTHK